MTKLAGAFLLAMLSAFLALPGCQPKAPTPQGPPGAISCTAKAISDHAGQLVGPTNECLRGNGDVTDCLLGLVQPAAGITLEAVLCVVRHEGSAASSAAQANADDAPDVRRAARAREFLQRQHATFSD